MSLTVQTSNALANHLYRNVNFASPPQVWMGLITSAGNELNAASSLGYARVRLDDKLGAASNGIVQSNAAVSFPVASSAWTAAKIGLWTDQQFGTLLQVINLPSSLTVPAGVILRFPATTIRLGLGAVPDGIWQNGQIVSDFDIADGYWEGGVLQANEPDGYWFQGTKLPDPPDEKVSMRGYENDFYAFRTFFIYDSKYSNDFGEEMQGGFAILT
jgi:hypothetical protein